MKIKGIAASDGIAIAKAFKLHQADLRVEKREIDGVDEEVKRFKNAIAKSHRELEAIRDQTRENIGGEQAGIFDAHLQMLKDPEFTGAVIGKIETEEINGDFALREVADQFIAIFQGMENEYMRERAADIEDVTRRLLAHLLGVRICNPALINEEVIIVADDLTPSDTAQLNKDFVKGFATNVGGRTSHCAIMARSMGIPAVVGTKKAFASIEDGDTVILDGIGGRVFVNPKEERLNEYAQKEKEYEEKKSLWAKFKDQPSISLDGHEVELAANIGSPNDLEAVVNNGGEGIGLYRTEFLFMKREDFPSEEEQFEAYKKVLERMEGKPVVIRTLDIGGDKDLSYMDLPKELNPFLGHRGIRLCLEQREVFKTQLRAMLRAGVHGNLKIMFPMIATLEEFREARDLVNETKEELLKAGTAVAENPEIGIMVEVPSTAILADQFAKEVDFFSIGTNDLIQYTFAADRMNENVSYLYQPYHPSLLRLTKMVIDAAHKEGKWAGMCGEMAGDPTALPILLGLGLDEFSMSAGSILPARCLLSRLRKKDMEELANKALTMNSNEDVRELVNQTIGEGS